MGDPPVGPAAEGMQIETLPSGEVNKYKWDVNGTLDRRKHRTVVGGHLQRAEFYEGTFAPAPQLKTLRFIMALSLIWDLTVYNFDVVSAFMNSPMKYDVWMKLPTGFDFFGKYQYAKLKKCLYGLKQGAYCWYEEQDKFVRAYDPRFHRSSIDPCMYYIIDWPSLIVLIWVQTDNYVCATNDEEYCKAFAKAYNDTYAVEDHGELTQVMQTQFNRKDAYAELRQTRHIDDLVAKYSMEDAKPKYTPMQDLPSSYCV